MSRQTPPRPSTLEEWLIYWENLHQGQSIDLSLQRVKAVSARFAWHINTPIITVAGTNGKGSVCAFLTAIYRAAGFSVGAFFSPHIHRFNERITLNNQPVDDDTLISAFERLDHIRAEISLTYFEANTLAAMLIFLEGKVDVIILEVGLGGRLDAVNLFDANVAILSNADLDHQAYLGDTREAIGREKAGIFRQGRPAIVGEQNPPESVLEVINDIGAVPLMYGLDFFYEKMSSQWNFSFQPRVKGYQAQQKFALPFPILRGSYQLGNASMALCAIECLREYLPVDVGSIKKGLLSVRHPGRFEILPQRPMVVLDVAHNPHAALALRRDLHCLPYAKKHFAVFAMFSDKAVEEVVHILKGEFEHWFIAPLPSRRSACCAYIRDVLLKQEIKAVTICKTIPLAYQAAMKQANEEDRIVVFGSFLTVAGAMRVISNVQEK